MMMEKLQTTAGSLPLLPPYLQCLTSKSQHDLIISVSASITTIHFHLSFQFFDNLTLPRLENNSIHTATRKHNVLHVTYFIHSAYYINNNILIIFSSGYNVTIKLNKLPETHDKSNYNARIFSMPEAVPTKCVFIQQ